VIGCEDHLQNYLYFVGWGVKLYSIQSKSSVISNCIVVKFDGIVFQVNVSIDRVRFSIWCHNFKMVAMMLFHAEKCHTWPMQRTPVP